MSGDFLDAFAELNAAFGADEGLLRLPLELVFEDPQQPREAFDEGELRDLAETVRRHGLLQPIVVRPADASGRYMVRFGARRLRAVRLAGLTEVTALVRGGDASEAEILIEQVLENDQRTGLSTAERARGVERLLGLGLSQAEIARALRQPTDVITMLAAVKRMPPVLQRLAPALGARTLYSLFGAWKADAVATEAWLSGRSGASVTQAEARDLAGRLTAPPSDRSGSTSAAKRSSEPRSRRAAAGAAICQVEVVSKGRSGVLELRRPPFRDGEAWVRFEGAEQLQSVPVATLSIRRVRPPKE